MPSLDSLNKLLNEAAEKLDHAANEIRDIPLEPPQDYIRKIGEALVSIIEIRQKIYELRPDLQPTYLKQPKPDPDLTEEQKAVVAKLSPQDLEAIDNALMSEAQPMYQKVAKIVGFAMMNQQNRIEGIPDVFYSQRVRKLVKEGRLESDGNLHYMGRSEVRLTQGKNKKST